MVPRKVPMRTRTLGWLGTIALSAASAAAAFAQQESPPSPAPANEDSVVEAARKARAAKAKGKPRKVFTEDDLPGLRRNIISTVGEASPEPLPDAEAQAGSPNMNLETTAEIPPGERDEAYWRQRAGKLQGEIADVDRQIEALREEIRKAGGAGFDPQSGLGVNVMYYTDRNNRLQQLQRRRDGLQKQMDALMDEARRAGVPPGWLR
jgi:hypothetical protein